MWGAFWQSRGGAWVFRLVAELEALQRLPHVPSVPNRPGAVHDLLVPLKKHGVSMTRFESRPAKSGQWEYYFYIDIQGHISQPPVAAALQELQGLCAFYKVLGSYPVSE